MPSVIRLKRSPLFEVRVRVQMATGAEYTGTQRIRGNGITDVITDAPADDLGMSDADAALVSHAMENEPDSVRLLEITVERVESQ